MRVGPEISWILEGKSPDQIPMARLAEYMRYLAAMLGEIDNVHFARVERGSTRLVATFSRGMAVQRVQARVSAVRDRRAPAEAMRAFHRINDMVGEDESHARITFGAGVMLRFPGSNYAARWKPLNIVDRGTVTGRLYSLLEEPSGLLKARIRPRTGSTYVACTAEGSIGRELRNYFLDAVRVHGRGTWSRAESGEWTCQSLQIENVQQIKDVSLREAINALRAIAVEWPDDPLADWDAIEETDGAA
jgi:hypothetical protein